MPPKTRKAKAKRAPTKRRPVRGRGAMLDPQAVAYARLLNDPCAAPLTHPVYSGSDSGLIARFENYYTANTTVTNATSGYFVWTPGAIGNNGGAGPAFAQGEAALPGSAVTAATIGTTTQPGWNYLSTNSGAVRCVSACIQLFFAGAESARSGLIAYGGVSGSSILSGSSLNPQQALQLFEKYDRVPNSSIEVKWRPGNFDQDFTNPSTGTSVVEISRRQGLGFAWTGLPANVGIIVRMVAVYEYIPIFSSGLVVPYNSRSTSNSTLDHVVNYLDSTGEWMYNMGRVAGSAYNVARQALPFVQAVSYAGSRVVPMLGM